MKKDEIKQVEESVKSLYSFYMNDYTKRLVISLIIFFALFTAGFLCLAMLLKGLA